MDPTNEQTGGGTPVNCAECGLQLADGQERQQTEDAVFCRPCFERLTLEVDRAIAVQGQDVNYTMAFVGGLAGAALGAAAWWGFTVLTNIAFGLVAVVIAFAVGKGVTMLSGGKRHLNLQIMSVAISFLAFVYASFLVNRTFILRFLAEEGQEGAINLLPSPDVFYEVVIAGAGVMDLVFLAIVLYQAWKIPAPYQLAQAS